MSLSVMLSWSSSLTSAFAICYVQYALRNYSLMLYNKGQDAGKEAGTVSKGILDLAFSPSQKRTAHNKIWTNCTMAACL